MVILVFHKNHLRRVIILLNLVRTGTDQVCSESPVFACLCACILREDICVGSTEVLYERSKCIVQSDCEVVIIHDLKSSQLRCISVEHVLCALDHVEICGALCSGCRVEHTLKCELDILTRKLSSVREMNALLQLERIYKTIIGNRREIGQKNRLLVVVIIETQKALSHLVCNRSRS